jgi:4-oxalocrotonate tautomerase
MEKCMPHVIVKMWPGPSEQQKALLAKRIVKDVIESLDSSDESISVAIEEVSPQDWMAEVYNVQIAPNMSKLYKKPGYDPF